MALWANAAAGMAAARIDKYAFLILISKIVLNIIYLRPRPPPPPLLWLPPPPLPRLMPPPPNDPPPWPNDDEEPELCLCVVEELDELLRPRFVLVPVVVWLGRVLVVTPVLLGFLLVVVPTLAFDGRAGRSLTCEPCMVPASVGRTPCVLPELGRTPWPALDGRCELPLVEGLMAEEPLVGLWGRYEPAGVCEGRQAQLLPPQPGP